MEKHDTTGQRLAYILKETGTSQKALALHLRVTPSAVSQWISDINEPNATRLFEIEDFTGYSARWLATGQGTPRDNLREHPVIAKLAAFDPQTRKTLLALINEMVRIQETPTDR